MAERQFDLTRDTLAVVFLFALIAASVWIFLPFLGAVVWATMIVVATWPSCSCSNAGCWAVVGSL